MLILFLFCRLNPLRASLILLLSLGAPGCEEPALRNDDDSETLGDEGQSTPTPQLKIPQDYHGPIDPQWPPRRPIDLEVELSTNRLILKRLDEGMWGKVKGAPLITVKTSVVHATEGRIGGFDYIEVVLGEGVDPQETMPLVVLLHGRGGRATIPPGPYLSKYPLRLFIPRAPDPLNGGYNWLATWTNSGEIELLARSLAGRVDELMPAIEAFSQLRPTLGKPIVVGFSQGGILCFGLAMRHPKYFRAVFPIAGWLPASLIPDELETGVTHPYIHALHGGADSVVPTEKGRSTVHALKQLGLTIDYSEVPEVGHKVTKEMNETVRHWIGEQTTAMHQEQKHLLEQEKGLLFTATPQQAL